MLRSYVKRTGHFTSAQKKAYESLSPEYIIPFCEDKLDFHNIFSNDNIILEIGFGCGFATAEISQANPDKNYIGIEVHKPGIGKLLWEIEKRNLKNIKIIEYDAVLVLEKMIPHNSLDGIHIFFPDPWPKKKHNKRRLIKRPFTDTLAKCLKKGGYIFMVTDWEDYADSALFELTSTEGLLNSCGGFAPPQSWRPMTRFEQKGREKNHEIRELLFNKI